jgi:hypothetical protein
MQSLVAAKIKRAQAVELAARGSSYAQIATEVGFSHRGSAHRAVSKALAKREIDAVDDLRLLELHRLDSLQASLWAKAMDGDLAAAALVLQGGGPTDPVAWAGRQATTGFRRTFDAGEGVKATQGRQRRAD